VVFPVPDKPPTATSSGGFERCPCPLPLIELRQGKADDLGTDRRPDAEEDGQQRQAPHVIRSRLLPKIAVETGIRGLLETALPQIHDQEGEIVEHVASGHGLVELERVEQNGLAVDDRDISQMQIAVAAPHKSGIAPF